MRIQNRLNLTDALPPFTMAMLMICLAAGCGFQQSGNESTAQGARLDSRQSMKEPFCITLIGIERCWKAVYPPVNGTESRMELLQSGGTLRVPVDTNVTLSLRSEDFLYMLEVPELGLREIAVPGLEFQASFHASQTGKFQLAGDELCGLPETSEPAWMVIEPRTSFLAWISRPEIK